MVANAKTDDDITMVSNEGFWGGYWKTIGSAGQKFIKRAMETLSQ